MYSGVKNSSMVGVSSGADNTEYAAKSSNVAFEALWDVKERGNKDLQQEAISMAMMEMEGSGQEISESSFSEYELITTVAEEHITGCDIATEELEDEGLFSDNP